MKMAKILVVMFMILGTMFLLTACGGGSTVSSGTKPQDMHGGEITLNDNTQVIEFDLAGGIIKGVIHEGDIRPEDIESVNFNSARVGWKENSCSVALFGNRKVELPNTPNNDQGTWTLKLKSGEYAWFNVDQWSYVGKPFVKTVDDLIGYGGFTPSTITFLTPDKAVINFGSNVIYGQFIVGNSVGTSGPFIGPGGVVRIHWNSDRVGWNESSVVYGELQMDVKGNYFAVIEGMPNNDKGNFSVLLSNGIFVWFNIDKWIYSTNAVLDHTAGQIEYNMTL